MEKQPKVFTEGFIFKKPRVGAPDFVKGAISIKVEEFVVWLKKHQNNGWVNIDLKMSKEGKLYTELNNFKIDAPKTDKSTFVTSLTPEEIAYVESLRKGQVGTKSAVPYPESEINPDDITFN